jgi:hypothetical protein
MMKVILAVPLVGLLLFAPVASAKDIVHDAELCLPRTLSGPERH